MHTVNEEYIVAIRKLYYKEIGKTENHNILKRFSKGAKVRLRKIYVKGGQNSKIEPDKIFTGILTNDIQTGLSAN